MIVARILAAVVLATVIIACNAQEETTDEASPPRNAQQEETPSADAPRSKRQKEKGFIPPEQRTDRKAEFSVRFNDNVTPHDVTAVFAMPGETIEFETVFEREDSSVSVATTAGDFVETEDNRWEWTAPDEPGFYPITLTAEPSGAVSTLNAFAMVPADEVVEGKLGEFRVGTYPPGDEVGQKALYDNPEGFVEVTRETVDVLLSPHFKLGQFVSKQPSDIPKYVYLHERLLLKLEMLIEQFNSAGIEVDTFHIMSGYRTPFYNEAIGNVEFSRHVFGDAADIFVDKDGNGRMDDLDGDGKSDMGDAQLLADTVETLVEASWYEPFIGGLGIYGPAPHRGPFIHVDTRGYKARWTSP